ncbi:hypothetical protein RYX36_020667, partial [Vicia faba]
MHNMLNSALTRCYLQNMTTRQFQLLSVSLYSTFHLVSTPPELQGPCNVVTITVGGLDDIGLSLNKFKGSITSPLVAQVIDFIKNEAHTRRLLRFFLWSNKNLRFDLEEKDYNFSLRVFAEKRDYTAMDILLGDLEKDGRVLDAQSFGLVAESFVKLRKEDEAIKGPIK